MLMRPCCAVLLGLCPALLLPARADDVEGVREKLFQAKKEYDGEVQKFRKAIGEVFDKKEEDARKTGNKKLVDQVKTERARFEESSDPPAELPPAARTQLATARSALDKAYQAA